jgi:hypothetical protein
MASDLTSWDVSKNTSKYEEKRDTVVVSRCKRMRYVKSSQEKRRKFNHSSGKISKD